MNKVLLVGNIASDLELRYTSGKDPIATLQFPLALNRTPSRKNPQPGADFPRVCCFGRTAENVEKYCHKGSQIAVEGSLRTGSYEKNGQTIYTTDVNAYKVEFLRGNHDNQQDSGQAEQKPAADDPAQDFEDFGSADDVPF